MGKRGGVKREWRTVGSRLPSNNKYSALSSRVMNKVSRRLSLETGIKPTASLSAIDKENSLRVPAVLCLSYIQGCLFTDVCPWA